MIAYVIAGVAGYGLGLITIGRVFAVTAWEEGWSDGSAGFFAIVWPVTLVAAAVLGAGFGIGWLFAALGRWLLR